MTFAVSGEIYKLIESKTVHASNEIFSEREGFIVNVNIEVSHDYYGTWTGVIFQHCR